MKSSHLGETPFGYPSLIKILNKETIFNVFFAAGHPVLDMLLKDHHLVRGFGMEAIGLALRQQIRRWRQNPNGDASWAPYLGFVFLKAGCESIELSSIVQFEMQMGPLNREFKNYTYWKWLPNPEDIPKMRAYWPKVPKWSDINQSMFTICWLNQVMHTMFRLDWCPKHSLLIFKEDK